MSELVSQMLLVEGHPPAGPGDCQLLFWPLTSLVDLGDCKLHCQLSHNSSIVPCCCGWNAVPQGSVFWCCDALAVSDVGGIFQMVCSGELVSHMVSTHCHHPSGEHLVSKNGPSGPSSSLTKKTFAEDSKRREIGETSWHESASIVS